MDFNGKDKQGDDDDFEEDEDDEDQQGKVKISGLAGILCSFIPKIQEEVGDKI
jgi:hypothetical protein